MRVLVTRPQPAADHTAEKLRASGYRPIVFPLSRVEYVVVDGTELSPASGVIFTSENAVKSLQKSSDVPPDFLTHPIFTVGKKTEKAAKDLGFQTVFCADGDGEQLAHLIIRVLVDGQIILKQDQPLLYLTQEDRTPKLEQILAKNQIAVKSIITYQVQPDYVQDQFEKIGAANEIDMVLFYSASAAQRFFQSLSQSNIKLFTSARYGCLSFAIASRIPKEFSDRIVVAEQPKEHHLLMAIGISP